MHGSLIIALGLWAVWLRWRWQPTQAAWQQRWQRALLVFGLPPLLLLSAAAAILWMGDHGSMLGLSVTPWGCWMALGLLLVAGGTLAYGVGQGVRSHLSLRRYPQRSLPTGEVAYALPLALPFAARVGFWQSRLVVSEGLLTHLDSQSLQAILAHEAAHHAYRDTFWFFWLGWLRRLTRWLPNTEALWQELLLLREIRADCWAAERVDPLLLAEMLVKLVAFPLSPSLEGQVAFQPQLSISRLEQRVDALLSETTTQDVVWRVSPFWAVLPLLPLATVLLHT